MNNSNLFNKIRFKISSIYGVDGANAPQWFDGENLTPYDSNTHGQEKFKNLTKSFELLKCPVNPQQTSFKYLKLQKKAMVVKEVYDLIGNFYWWGTQSKISPCRLENLIDIEPDVEGIIARLIDEVGNGTEYWAKALGPCTRFKEIVEETVNGFKTYRVVFEHE